jgi:hypothetical protein
MISILLIFSGCWIEEQALVGFAFQLLAFGSSAFACHVCIMAGLLLA